MERLSTAVLDAFGIHSRSIKKEKGHFKVNTASGLVRLHITNESAEAIRTQHAIKEHLAAQGFPTTDRYLVAKSGHPYILMGRDTYIAATYPNSHQETNFDNEPEVIASFETLANFHKAASYLTSEKISISAQQPDHYLRQQQELVQAGKQARRGPRMSDFDVAFITHAPQISAVIEEATEQLAKTNYTKMHAQAVARGSLCHNAMKEENFDGNGTYLVNFSQATIDLQLTDLAALLRRYAQRSSKSIPANRLVEVYDAINPLPHQAIEILYAQLIFPWAFMKLVSQFYSKKRNWTPIGLISRMETMLAEREAYDAYVRALH